MSKPTIPALSRLENAMDTMRRAVTNARERLGSDLQLTRTQLEILMILTDKPAQTTSELARGLFLTQSAVTQTIDTLARRGLIERRPDEHDRRIIHLHLSSTGLEITSKVRRLRHKHIQELVSQLTEGEINAMITATEKFAALLEDTQYPNKH